MKKILIWALVVVIIGLAGYFVYNSYQKRKMAGDAATAPQQGQAANTENQVQGQEVKIGTGKEVKPGTMVTVEYVGKLADGTVFDSSAAQKKPLVFTLGVEGIIPGFQIGVNGMKEGGERLLAIPPALAYGDQQVGVIPPNSTLIFEVKLIKVEEPKATTSPAGR